MKFHELKTKRAQKTVRVGRGIAAGGGKTAGRGTKGQGARKSGGVRPGFEGGQMPVYMRLPHLRGFKSHRVATETVYTGQLETQKKSSVDNQSLFEAGFLNSPYSKAKLIVKGELKSKREVKLQAASKSAIKALESAGGTFTKVERIGRPTTKKTKE